MNSSPLQELHASLGARALPAEAGGDVLTYGDVPGEVEAGREGALLFDRTTSGLVAVAGPDATDALAIALCHAFHARAGGKLEAALAAAGAAR